ncbi:MAG: transposase domain-containing protein [Planctomycetota bacterium]
MYSRVATCRRCHIDPFAYLRDVLDRVSTHPVRRIAEMMPSSCKS